MNKSIQIFKSGERTDSNGVTRNFTEADLKASAAAYDPAKHEAPLVVGHPQADKPRFGGVGSLVFSDGLLNAEPKDVVSEFADWVGRKMFNQVSASFYAPDSPHNPVPGVYYLRHVGFLGAQPPAVKGLNPHGISFSANEEGVIEFTDYDDVQNASLWRGLREWFISKFGTDEADRVIPNYAVQTLEVAARQENDDGSSAIPSFSETQIQGDKMSVEKEARLTALEKENAEQKQRLADFAEGEKKRVVAARHAENVSFTEGLIKAGKLLPVAKDQTVALLDNLGAQDAAIEFGEGDGKKSATALALYKAQLEALPKVVEFGEKAGGEGATGDGEMAPETLAAKAIEFQESEAKAGRTVNSAQAVAHVKQSTR